MEFKSIISKLGTTNEFCIGYVKGFRQNTGQVTGKSLMSQLACTCHVKEGRMCLYLEQFYDTEAIGLGLRTFRPQNPCVTIGMCTSANGPSQDTLSGSSTLLAVRIHSSSNEGLRGLYGSARPGHQLL